MKDCFKNFVEAYHKKNFQVTDGERDSIFPERFLLEAISNYQVFPVVTRGLSRQILESIHKISFIIERLTLI